MNGKINNHDILNNYNPNPIEEETSPIYNEYKKSKKPLLIFMFFILFVIGSGLTYIFITGMPKYVFGKTINNIYQTFNKSSLALGDTYEITGDLSIDAMEMLGMVFTDDETEDTKINLNLTYKQDAKNENAELIIKNKGKEFNYLSLKDRSYFYDSDLNKYVEITTGDKIDYISDKEQKYFSSTIKKVLQKNLKSNYFKAENDEIKIGDKNKKVNKTIFTLNEKVLGEYLNNSIKDLKKDKKFVEIAKKMDIDFSEYNETDLKNSLKGMPTIIFNIYTTKYFNKIVRYELEYSNSTIAYTNINKKESKLEFIDTVITILKDKNKTTFELYDGFNIEIVHKKEKIKKGFEFEYAVNLITENNSTSLINFKGKTTNSTTINSNINSIKDVDLDDNKNIFERLGELLVDTIGGGMFIDTIQDTKVDAFMMSASSLSIAAEMENIINPSANVFASGISVPNSSELALSGETLVYHVVVDPNLYVTLFYVLEGNTYEIDVTKCFAKEYCLLDEILENAEVIIKK